MADIGTTQMDSIRMAAEKPASASEPKPLTTDCTSIIPMDTVDCWRIDGIAIRVISDSSIVSNSVFCFPSRSFRFLIRTAKERTAEIPCAIKVAQATPATPISIFVTMIISRTTLNTEENIRKYSGILDFPSALNIAESTLYIKRKGSPKK